MTFINKLKDIFKKRSSDTDDASRAVHTNKSMATVVRVVDNETRGLTTTSRKAPIARITVAYGTKLMDDLDLPYTVIGVNRDNNDARLLLRCNMCGHIRMSTPYNIKRGSKSSTKYACPYCKGEKIKHGKIKEVAIAKSGDTANQELKVNDVSATNKALALTFANALAKSDYSCIVGGYNSKKSTLMCKRGHMLRVVTEDFMSNPYKCIHCLKEDAEDTNKAKESMLNSIVSRYKGKLDLDVAVIKSPIDDTWITTDYVLYDSKGTVLLYVDTHSLDVTLGSNDDIKVKYFEKHQVPGYLNLSDNELSEYPNVIADKLSESLNLFDSFDFNSKIIK